jgi:hypothetical protein
MKKKYLKTAIPAFLGAAALALILAACVQDSGVDDNDDDEEIIPPVTSESTRKVNTRGKQIIHTLWCEGAWQDPRIAMGYKLEQSGKLWFDRYVMLYGGRIMNRDCVNNPLEDDTHCTHTGLHLHIHNRMYTILENYATYIKPLQDAGIKFLIGLVPSGGGVCHGTLYSWPMEDVWPWKANTGQDYPFGEAATQQFIDQIKEAVIRYHLDGIGFDDEYGNLSGASGTKGPGAVYPSEGGYYSSTDLRNAAWKRGGENMLRFAYELTQQIPGIILECYEIRYGQYIPASMTYKGQTIRMKDVISISYEPNYGTWQPESGSGNARMHMPRAQFGPVSMDLGSGTATNALPPANRNGVVAAMTDHISGGYGVNMFFSMVSRDAYSKQPQYTKFFGNGHSYPEWYFTMIAQVLFGKDEQVIYEGRDYFLDF